MESLSNGETGLSIRNKINSNFKNILPAKFVATAGQHLFTLSADADGFTKSINIADNVVIYNGTAIHSGWSCPTVNSLEIGFNCNDGDSIIIF